jgi:hypothetical protein
MASPRQSSTGSFKTFASCVSPYPSHNPVSSDQELIESSCYVAETHMSSFIAAQATKGWLGKTIFDAAELEGNSTDKARELAARCWSTLISFDNIYIDARYRVLFNPPDAVNNLKRRVEMLDRCWNKCTQILKDAARDIAALSPAYLRSPQFALRRFIDIVILQTLETQEFRHRWVRILNLIDSVVNTLARAMYPREQEATSQDRRTI